MELSVGDEIEWVDRNGDHVETYLITDVNDTHTKWRISWSDTPEEVGKTGSHRVDNWEQSIARGRARLSKVTSAQLEELWGCS